MTWIVEWRRAEKIPRWVQILIVIDWSFNKTGGQGTVLYNTYPFRNEFKAVVAFLEIFNGCDTYRTASLRSSLLISRVHSTGGKAT